MNGANWFDVSYLALCILLIISAVALHRVLFETEWMAAVRDRLRPVGLEMRGQQIPNFAASTLGGRRTFTAPDIIGREAIVLFLRPEDSSLDLDTQIRTSAYALFDKSRGNLYVVCSGSHGQCRGIATELRLSEYAQRGVPIIVDAGEEMARAWLVRKTPTAFRISADGRITDIGEQWSVG